MSSARLSTNLDTLSKKGRSLIACELNVLDVLEMQCMQAAATAAGLDSLEPAEMKLLSKSAFPSIAVMLDMLEQQSKWPAMMLHAKAVFTQKDLAKAEDFASYRVFTILPSTGVWLS